MGDQVVATMKAELNQDGSYLVVGCIQDKALALQLLDVARAQVIKYHKNLEPNEVPVA